MTETQLLSLFRQYWKMNGIEPPLVTPKSFARAGELGGITDYMLELREGS